MAHYKSFIYLVFFFSYAFHES